jgi:hypothetical protein
MIDCLGGQVKMMTTNLPCGKEAVIDIEENTRKLEIKRLLEPITGVPIEHQKVILSGVNQLAFCDKR